MKFAARRPLPDSQLTISEQYIVEENASAPHA